MTPAFSGRSCSRASAPETKQTSRNTGLKTLQGERSKPCGFRLAAPGSPRSHKGAQGGRLPCPLRGRTRPEPPRSLCRSPPFRGPPGLGSVVWPPAPELTCPSPAAVRPSVPNSVHTQRLPAPAGSRPNPGQEVWPPPTHTPTFSAGWEPGVPVAPASGAGLRPPGGKNSGLPPPTHSPRPSGLFGPQSQKDGVS